VNSSWWHLAVAAFGERRPGAGAVKSEVIAETHGGRAKTKPIRMAGKQKKPSDFKFSEKSKA
jgi:hypothetical protein